MDDQIGTDALRAFLQAWNDHDADAVAAFFTEDGVFEGPRGAEVWGTRAVGRDAIREAAARRFEIVPDIHYSEDEHWVCGDRAASEWTVTGTSVDGKPFKARGCDLLRVSDGKILKKDSYWKIRE